MNLYAVPTIVCRCGRIFFDGEDVWPHVREEHKREEEYRRWAREMQEQRAHP